MLTDGEVSMQDDFKSNDGISKPLSLFFSSLAENLILCYACYLFNINSKCSTHLKFIRAGGT